MSTKLRIEQSRPTLYNNCILQSRGLDRLAVILENLGREGGLQNKRSRTRLSAMKRIKDVLSGLRTWSSAV